MKPFSSILIVDDEPQLRELLGRLLSVEGFDVVEADTARNGFKQLENFNFYSILLDVRLPDGNGVELTKIIKEKYPETEIILFTAYGDISDGVNGIKNGAFDYLRKGDDNNKIIPLVNKAIEKSKLQFQIKMLKHQQSMGISFDSIIGKSVLMQHSVSLSKKVAPTDASILLTGPTGTGKEIFARAIHNESARSLKGFVILNCSFLSKEILEGELFGFKAGSVTGKQGLIEDAQGGTLFLDEIGEMPLELQAKLLRFLETGEYFKVGDTKSYKADVRIISSTNKEIKKEIEKNNFRSDLFFRIATFEIRLPALNERKEDIPMLAGHFILFYANKVKKKINGYTAGFMEKLKAYNWPGNIRELRSTIERACILCDKTELDEDTLPLDFIVNYPGTNKDSTLNLSEAEKQHILKVLHISRGNKTKAAELLGIGLSTLYRKIEEYEILVN